MGGGKSLTGCASADGYQDSRSKTVERLQTAIRPRDLCVLEDEIDALSGLSRIFFSISRGRPESESRFSMPKPLLDPRAAGSLRLASGRAGSGV